MIALKQSNTTTKYLHPEEELMDLSEVNYDALKRSSDSSGNNNNETVHNRNSSGNNNKRRNLRINGNKNGNISIDHNNVMVNDMNTPLSHAMSTPTTNTYVYHANAPRLVDIDNDPFGCTLDDECDDDDDGGESVMIDTVNNAQKHLSKTAKNNVRMDINKSESIPIQSTMAEEDQLEITYDSINGGNHSHIHQRGDTLNTLQTPMPHNISSVCLTENGNNKQTNNGESESMDLSDRHVTPQPHVINEQQSIPIMHSSKHAVSARHRSTIPHSLGPRHRIYNGHTPPPIHNNNHHPISSSATSISADLFTISHSESTDISINLRNNNNNNNQINGRQRRRRRQRMIKQRMNERNDSSDANKKCHIMASLPAT